ncbi:MAG TPA: ester cyclase [Chryseolinea sp.]|nr:ester cyclase [Chryseolinea sp.]
MQALTNYPIFLAIALALISCGDGQKSQTSKLDEQTVLEEANLKTVRSFYEFMDKQESTSLEKLIGKDFALFFGSSEEPIRYSQIKPLIKEVYLAFPDYKHEIEIIFASGQYVTVKLDHIGTHTNTYMGIAPTGKKVSYKSIFIFTLKDGLITDVHGVEESLAALIKAQ